MFGNNKGLDFIGTKVHGDLADNFVTVDVAEAFLNDPCDWDGPHEPIVASTEADMDAALTMQLFKLISKRSWFDVERLKNFGVTCLSFQLFHLKAAV